jgi:hypothetical protein
VVRPKRLGPKRLDKPAHHINRLYQAR